MNPTTVQNVVTYDTIIEFANPDLKLFPGMTAYVTIPVATAENALKIPNTALRYKPPMSLEEIRAVYEKHGIETGEPLAGQGRRPPPRRTRTVQRPARPARPARDSAVVWKLHSSDGTIEPVQVSLGLTDHTYTEVTGMRKGSLQEGDELVVRSVSPKSQGPAGIRR